MIVNDLTNAAAEDEACFFKELIPAVGADSEVGLNIIRAADFLFDRARRVLAPFGMSEPQFNVLAVLETVPEGLTMCEMARRMLISRAGMTGLVKGMEAKGWIARGKVPGDARAVCLRITPAGLAILEQIMPNHLRSVEETVGDCFSDTEKAELIRLLTRLRGHLAEWRAAQ